MLDLVNVMSLTCAALTGCQTFGSWPFLRTCCSKGSWASCPLLLYSERDRSQGDDCCFGTNLPCSASLVADDAPVKQRQLHHQQYRRQFRWREASSSSEPHLLHQSHTQQRWNTSRLSCYLDTRPQPLRACRTRLHFACALEAQLDWQFLTEDASLPSHCWSGTATAIDRTDSYVCWLLDSPLQYAV